MIPADDTQLTSIKTPSARSLAEIRRANTIHLEGRIAGWNTWIAVIAIGAVLFLSFLVTIWLIRKYNRNNGKIKGEAFSLRNEQEANATELTRLFFVPPSSPNINRKKLEESESRVMKATEEFCAKAHTDGISVARYSLQSLEARIIHL